MRIVEHPAWAEYKATLARVAEASLRLTRAERQGPADLAALELELAEALKAYHLIRARMARAGSRDPALLALSSSDHAEPANCNDGSQGPYDPEVLNARLGKAYGDNGPRQMQHGGGEQEA